MIFLAGIIMAFNLLVILHKFRKCKLVNAIIDLFMLWIVFILTVGTYSGMAMGMIASLLISIYLWYVPIEEKDWCKGIRKELEELKEILDE